jgi:iron complex outermembrane receptor protein
MAVCISVTLAVSCLAGSVFAQTVAQSYQLNIPRQPLDAALKDLAEQTGLQIARFSDDSAGATVVGPVKGVMSVGQAIDALLGRSGLTYKLVNERTIAVVARDSERSEARKLAGDAIVRQSPEHPAVDRDKEGRNDSRDRFRLARVGEGQAAAAVPIATPLDEITVTATRQEQSISKVPISVSAFNQDQLDTRGVKTFNDLVQITPGISLSPSLAGESVVSIRGVASTAGAATTGVYIDDTPIQVRSIGYSPGNTYPTVFDLDRIEILRGPQGTLFGAGSEGGTVRFIQPQVSLTTDSVYARAETAAIDRGGLSYEGGLAIGGPLIADTLGFRLSAFYRRDGGWIDAVTGTAVVTDASGKAGPDSVGLTNESIAQRNTNYDDTKLLRAALKWAPHEGLTLAPSVTYQEGYKNQAVASFWPELSNYQAARFDTYQPTPTVDATHLPIGIPVNQPQNERFVLPALNVDWRLGAVRLISNTSYFKREMTEFVNFYVLEDLTFAGFPVPEPGDLSDGNYINSQHNITQEIRLQPTDTQGRLDWTAGFFFQRAAQLAAEGAYSNFVGLLPRVLGAVDNGQPFGAGSSAYVNWYGLEPLDGTETWYGHFLSVDKQYALYGQADYPLGSRLKGTLGLRVAREENQFEANYGGPENNLNAPLGRPCVTAGGCVAGEGIYTPAYQSGDSTAHELAVTPKVEVSYQASPAALYYASATKGFRPGGGEISLATACAAGLQTLGYADGRSPDRYGSDDLWSYEIGSKNKLLGGLLQYSASAYFLKWRDIQSFVLVNSCFQGFTANLGGATGAGLDLDLQLAPLPTLKLGVALSYSTSSFQQRVAPGGATVYSSGSAIPDSGAPLHVAGTIDYQAPLREGLSAYLHTDTLYSNAQRRTGATDPQSVDYDPMLAPVPATFQQNGRLGVRYHGLDLSVFVNNLTNAFPHLDLMRSAGTIVWTDLTWQPRTVGVTARYRY